MPWCEECSRYLTATSLGTDGECPRCGGEVARRQETEELPVPWHFKLLVLATVLYLGWRALQGVVWLAERM